MSIYLKAIKWKEWKEKKKKERKYIYIIIKRHGERDEDTDGGTYLVLFISKYHHKFLCIFLIAITNAFIYNRPNLVYIAAYYKRLW